MEAHKLASMAGSVTALTFGVLECGMHLSLEQPPPGQPAGVVPATPAAPPARTVDRTGFDGDGRLFALRDDAADGRLREAGQQLAILERRLEANSERLLRQLGQARLLEGDRKVNALAEVIQGMLNSDAMVRQYLSDLRGTLTGRVALPDDPAPP